MKYTIFVLKLILLLLIFSTSELSSQNNKVNWSSFNMGFSTASTTSNTSVMSVVGQGLIGTSQYQNMQVISGFLADTLLRRTIVSVSDEDELPTVFSLSQNYPNPFNPSTVISWQLPVSGWVTLKVYDVLGREVATLVDEYKSAGKYEVVFQSAVGSQQLAGGVYFYRLTAGDFVQTKKLLMIK